MLCRTLLIFTIISLVVPARAADTARIAYYPVSGKTARDIYDYIRIKAPRIAPNATFAYTAIATKTDKKEKTSGKSCRYVRFKTSGYYIFNLPRHTKLKSMSPKTRSGWLSFVNYLKNHEAGHRTSWHKCLADYDARAKTLTAHNCADLDKAREKLFTKTKLACIEQDEKMDYHFRQDVLKVPFVAEALGNH